MATRTAAAKLSSRKASLVSLKENFTGNGKYFSALRPKEFQRPLATSAARETVPEDSDSSIDQSKSDVPVNRSRGRFGRARPEGEPMRSFLDLWDPFFSSRSLPQMMNAVDRFFDDSFYSTPSRATQKTTPSAWRTPWDVVEDEEAFRLRVDMPGLTKEEVKVTVDDGTLVISGEHTADKSDNEKWVRRRSYGSYNTRMTLPDHVLVDQIKAEIKHGVLNVVMPKVKQNPKTTPIEVAVE